MQLLIKNFMDLSHDETGDFIIRTRNVLWREVARVGRPKELARAHVNLPSEAVTALELESKGDVIAFILRKGSKNVILTNLVESQSVSAKFEKDPQVLLEYLLSQVIILKSRKIETLENWENQEIDDHEFTQKMNEIRSQIKSLTDKLKQIVDSQFRGNATTSTLIVEKIRMDHNDYSNALVDYSQDLSSKIKSTEKILLGLNSAHSRQLIDNDEYLQEREEIESFKKFLLDTREEILKNLT